MADFNQTAGSKRFQGDKSQMASSMYSDKNAFLKEPEPEKQKRRTIKKILL